MNFKDFILEKVEKHAVLAFGRMNPPTIGHEALVNKVKDVAKNFKASHHVVLSHTQDAKKNPLTPQQKLKHAKRMFPGTNISLSDSSAPNFLEQAKKLHQQGVTHLHMVAGSDRTDEYYKLLHKYNGTHPGALFNFQHIKVHSAGERDPDAEGTAGMSASKMREHAKSGNYNEFRKGLPAHAKDEHAQELFQHVRQGMHIKEDLNIDFELLLTEGVNDKGIFKAVFLGGGPGSGKDYVLDRTLSGHGLTEINSDKALEFLMDKNNLDMRMPENEEEARNVVRSRAKTMTELKQKLALLGRNGLIINGTGDDVEKIAKIKERLENLGYETSMLMVNTADEVSKQRNIERGQRGGRTVPEYIRKKKWDDVQAARAEHAKLFGDNYHEFDNSEDLRTAPPEIRDAKEKEILQMYKNMQKFVNKPPKNPFASSWIADEMQKKDTQKINTKQEYVPHPESNAADEARKMGLTYYGFGRYGTKGKVTHRSIHDKLVAVTKQPSAINEAVTISFTADDTQELNQFFSNFLKTSEHNEQYQLSGNDAMNMLSLGKKTSVSEYRHDNVVFSNDDVEEMLESQKHNFMKNHDGSLRIYMLRRSAAKDAHQKNGEVVSRKKGGYLVKLNKEKNDVTKFSEEDVGSMETTTETRLLSENARASARSTSGSERRSTEASCAEENNQTSGYQFFKEETSPKEKLTIGKIRAKQKIQESIDKGIEPGISMAAAGESPARDMGEKNRKTGKASQVVAKGDLDEMAGANMNTRDVHAHLKKKGWELSRTSGGHDVFTHKNAEHHIAVPRHKNLKAPLVVGILKAAKNIREMTGDETTASISDRVEDDLKKKGINLTSFRARRPIG